MLVFDIGIQDKLICYCKVSPMDYTMWFSPFELGSFKAWEYKDRLLLLHYYGRNHTLIDRWWVPTFKKETTALLRCIFYPVLIHCIG